MKLVYEELGVSSLDELRNAATDGRLASLPGLGQKSQEKIIKGIENLKQHSGRHTLDLAWPIANSILARVRAVDGVKKAEIAGSLRRGKETVGDVDILVSANDSAPVMEEFLKTDRISDVLAQGETKSSIRLINGLQIDLRVVPKDSFGAALQYFTGSKEHNVKLRERAIRQGFRVNEYGIFRTDDESQVGGKHEKSIYKTLGLTYIEPELREGHDEIALAESNDLPLLIKENNIRSALHNHTTASDGRMSLEELAREAEKQGYRFLAVTDHSQSLGVANGLSPDRLRKQIDEVAKLNDRETCIPVLSGNEVDIRSDGSLDYDDDLLEQLDIVVASVHSALDQPRDTMTRRLCEAASNPHVDIMGHPTGRLLGRRPSFEVDWDKVFEAAAESGVVMEINAQSMRLDLNEKLIRHAMKYGVRFSINTDTHVASDFEHLRYGVAMARRGGLEKQHVINTMTLKQFRSWQEDRPR